MGTIGLRAVSMLALGLWASISAGVAKATPPLEAYGKLPDVQNVEVSRDGQYLALVVSNDTTNQVQIRRSSDLGMVSLIPTGIAKIRETEWAGDHHLLIITSATAKLAFLEAARHEWMMAFDFDLRTKKLFRLLDSQEKSLNTIFKYPQVVDLDGKPTAFMVGMTFPGTRGVLTLFRQDLDSHFLNVIDVGSEAARDWLVDPQGKVAARVEYQQATGEWILSMLHGTRKIRVMAPLDPPILEGYMPDGQSLLLQTTDETGKQYRTIAPGGDHWSMPIASLDGGELVRDMASRTAIGAVREKAFDIDYSLLKPADQKLWDAIRRAFPHDTVHVTSWSGDRVKVVLRVEGASGAGYYLLDSKTRQADWIANEYAGISGDDVAPIRTITYKAQDGTVIPAYLTLPRGVAATALPLIVLVHGGPAERNTSGFEWWPQALASRGYAVLQPQYRGSEGFGAPLMAAGFGEWGRKMQTDLSDGITNLAASGIVDPARVCIVGADYGGYAALAGVTLQSNIYRCAASLGGPTDLRQILSWQEEIHGGSRNETLRYWQRFMGARNASDPALDAISPLHLADHVHVPVLLMHGLDDTVVPYAQSKAMADALKQAGATVSLVTLKSEDHWLSRSETRLEMLRSLVDFLDKNLPVTNMAGGAAVAAH